MPFEVSINRNEWEARRTVASAKSIVRHYPLHIAAMAGVALGEPEDGDEDDDDEEEQGFQEDLPQNYVTVCTNPPTLSHTL